MLWATSPALTEVESRVLDWLVDLLGLPGTWKTSVGPGGGVIQLSTSDSTHLMHVVSRSRAVAAGADTDRLVAYGSSQAHLSVERGARIAGFRHIRLVDVDSEHAMRVDALRSAVAEDRAAGLTPAMVTSTVGTTGTGAIDPVAQVADVAAEAGMWHHVDAAWAGSAMCLPEHRHLQEGVEHVDSYTFNPHKWMFTNFDCDAFWVADRAALIRTLSVLPEYLRNKATESGAVFDYRDWQIPLGRRFRSLKLWFTLRTDGVEAIQAMIGDHVAWSQELAGWVRADDRFELVAPHPLNLVCFALAVGNEPTDRLIEAANTTGRALFTRSSVDGRSFVRFSVGGRLTERRHVQAGWELLQGLASDFT
jgi:aromatic-L-amino-acid decarboxylase